MDRCSQRVKIESPESVDREEGRRCDLERRDTPRYMRWRLVTQVSVRRILAPVTRAHAHAHPSQGSHNGTDRRIVRDCYDHQRRADTCIRSCMYERYMRNDVLDIRVHAASGQCIRYARSDVQPSRGWCGGRVYARTRSLSSHCMLHAGTAQPSGQAELGEGHR